MKRLLSKMLGYDKSDEETTPTETEQASAMEVDYGEPGDPYIHELPSDLLMLVWRKLDGVHLVRVGNLVCKEWNEYYKALDHDVWWNELIDSYESSVNEEAKEVLTALRKTSYKLSLDSPFKIYQTWVTCSVVFNGNDDNSDVEEGLRRHTLINPRRVFNDLVEAIDNAKINDVIFIQSGYYTNTVIDKPLIIVGKQEKTTLGVSLRSVKYKPSAMYCNEANEYSPLLSLFSLSVTDLSVSSGAVKLHWCIAGPLKVRDGGSLTMTGSLIRWSEEPIILRKGFKQISLSVSCSPIITDGATVDPKVIETVIERIKSHPMGSKEQKELYACFGFFNKVNKEGGIPKIVTERLFSYFWEAYTMTGKNLEIISSILENYSEFEPLKVLVEETAVKHILMSKLMELSKDAPTEEMLTIFDATRQSIMIQKDVDSSAIEDASFYFSCLSKFKDNSQCLLSILFAMWNYFHKSKQGGLYALASPHMMDQLFDAMNEKRSNTKFISSFCGVLWNFPSAQWSVKDRERFFSLIMDCLHATKDKHSHDLNSILGTVYSHFKEDQVRRIFVEKDGFTLLQKIAGTPIKTVKKKISWIVNSMLYYEDTMVALPPSILTFLNANIIEDKAVLFGIFATYGKERPDVLQETLHQFKVYLTRVSEWKEKHVWGAIDCLGSIALYSNLKGTPEENTWREAVEQLRPIVRNHSISVPRMSRWMRWTELAINGDFAKLYSVKHTPEVAVFTDGLTFRTKQTPGFGSTYFDLVSPLREGKWYYEVNIFSDGVMQIGWVTSGLEFQAHSNGLGVGDDDESWAADFNRLKGWHGKDNIKQIDYGTQKWTGGDTIGCFVDLDSRTMEFSLNGVKFGVAFSNFSISPGKGLCPGVSMTRGEECVFVFGGDNTGDFKYPPGDDWQSFSHLLKANTQK
eukprot:TRINITY_DN4572_c0_g1_i2.p1 TRINITY_DN4572_c0_g1~~TRINITY_DN4572_c0_g1_i2.p1  ORF type:complete len:914 (+),score=150.07 TRINITY_DN4572_c0_g1_i2:103-2844(+)